jgi:exodeoxyribonuclease V gamma subunit
VGCESRLIGETEDVALAPVAAPRDALGALAQRYWEGLHRPLPFFPESALAAFRRPQDPLGAARQQFGGKYTAEGDDPYVALAFRGMEPLGREFLALAHAVFGPLEASARSGA